MWKLFFFSTHISKTYWFFLTHFFFKVSLSLEKTFDWSLVIYQFSFFTLQNCIVKVRRVDTTREKCKKSNFEIEKMTLKKRAIWIRLQYIDLYVHFVNYLILYLLCFLFFSSFNCSPFSVLTNNTQFSLFLFTFNIHFYSIVWHVFWIYRFSIF